jgi:hypothetical protein
MSLTPQLIEPSLCGSQKETRRCTMVCQTLRMDRQEVLAILSLGHRGWYCILPIQPPPLGAHLSVQDPKRN